jgi:hypothetical protein
LVPGRARGDSAVSTSSVLGMGWYASFILGFTVGSSATREERREREGE